MQNHLPTWFVHFILRLIPRASEDSSLWTSYRNFYDNFYYKTSQAFTDHPEVKKLFYSRFEASIAGTLEPDNIIYVRPTPAYKKNSEWGEYGDIHRKMYKKTFNDEYYSLITSMGDFTNSESLREYVSQIRDTVNIDRSYDSVPLYSTSSGIDNTNTRAYSFWDR